MSKLKTLDKKIEEKAKIWYKRNLLPEYRNRANALFSQDKENIVKQYLKEHPEEKRAYDREKNKLRMKIAVLVGLSSITLMGGYRLNLAEESQENVIEQETEIEHNFIKQDDEQKEENRYENFFEEVRKIKNTDKREDYITDYTKQIIVEKYNKEHPEATITVERLETLILNESVRKNTDRLGNHTYERVPKNSEGKDLVKIGSIYDFRIDGKTVAVFDSNEDILTDKNVEKQDTSFKQAIKLVKQSQELKNIYKYRNNDYEKGKVEQKYQQIADEYLQDIQQIDLVKNENER